MDNQEIPATPVTQDRVWRQKTTYIRYITFRWTKY